MSKHTPGPWILKRHREHGPRDWWVGASDDAPVGIFSFQGGGASEEEEIANAQLLAAAPDLLKELRMLLLVTKCPCASTEDFSMELYWKRSCHRCVSAKAALAKAEGRDDE